MRRYLSSLALLGLAISLTGCVYDPLYGPPYGRWCYHHPRKCPPPPPPADYGPPPPPPMAGPPIPPPPPPPPRAERPEARQFVVFFEYNKSNLTPEAQRVIARAVKAARDSGAARISVTGHADTVGSNSYDQGLSERRAEVVKSALVSGGLDRARIETRGEGYHRPLVPTGPNVRELQNRRAVIEIEGGT
jgi:outer membrane protein OmpA-like peptidoglycan-associated protein